MPRKRHAEPSNPTPPLEPDVGDFFTVARLAARWGVSHHTIAAAIREGRLHAFKPNKRGYRIRVDEVARYEQQNMGQVAS